MCELWTANHELYDMHFVVEIRLKYIITGCYKSPSIICIIFILSWPPPMHPWETLQPEICLVDFQVWTNGTDQLSPQVLPLPDFFLCILGQYGASRLSLVFFVLYHRCLHRKTPITQSAKNTYCWLTNIHRLVHSDHCQSILQETATGYLI